MLPAAWVASAVIGGWIASRNKPHARCRKRTIIGPRTGIEYEADKFEDSGIIMVTDPQTGSSATFQKNPQGKGYLFVRGKGPRAKHIHLDILGYLPGAPQK